MGLVKVDPAKPDPTARLSSEKHQVLSGSPEGEGVPGTLGKRYALVRVGAI